MVVDDNDLDYERVERSLDRVGFRGRLGRAGDGAEALELMRSVAASGLPMVALIDLNMPRMGGIELLAAMRSDPLLAEVTVHILTTSTRPADQEQAARWGLAGYHVKPTRLADLRMLLATLLDQWRTTVFAAKDPGPGTPEP